MSKEIKFKPKLKSLKKHQVPDWFHDAKLGIFIHWGLYSVPAYAVTGRDIIETIRKEGFEGQFKNNAYAEWYLNTLRIEGSSANKYHKETYGDDHTYEDFIPEFNTGLRKWNPDKMTEIFKKAGAKYVVLVTKHHDGYLLWPSQYKHPVKGDYHTERDVVGELTKSVKDKGMKMGFYYSGTLDWSFNPNPIVDPISMVNNGVMTSEYTEYANNHWYELIDKYDPMILWNDIGYPPNTNVFEIMAYFYNKHPDGVINDRWSQMSKRLRKFLSFKPITKILNWAVLRVMTKEGAGGDPLNKHGDFSTPEYAQFHEIKKEKWESTRGIGNSFGYNKFETEKDYLSSEELIRMFIDIVSKNGNLLLNVGPMADGTIPKPQEDCLMGLGKWLEVNGEAIFGTRPWNKPEAITLGGIQVRFTQKPGLLYAILLDKPKASNCLIKNLQIKDISKIRLLGNENNLQWTQKADNLEISCPVDLKNAPAYTFEITLQ